MKIFLLVAIAVVAIKGVPQPQGAFKYSTSEEEAPIVPIPVAGNQPYIHVLARLEQVPFTAYKPEGANQRNDTQGINNQKNSTEDSVIESSTEPESEQIQVKNTKDEKSEKLVDGVQGEEVDQGIYYLYHPTGVLQKVAYATSNDARNMAYIAQLRYQNVEPIREPIYTYDPNTYLLHQVRV